MKTLYTAAIAASLFATAAAPAFAMTNQDPIHIQQILSTPDRNEGVPAVMHIAFDNTADVAAREVTFEITDPSGDASLVEDVGTFSKGVTISHDFHLALLSDGASARVVHVELADGSSWDASQAAPTHRQAAEIPSTSDDVQYSL